MTPEALLYNLALAQGLRKEAFVMPAMLAGGLGRAMLDIRHGERLPERMQQFQQDAQGVHPGDAAGAQQLMRRYRDLPHSTFSQIVGAKPTSNYARLLPTMATGFLPAAGVMAGMAGGPAGMALGAGLGAMGGHLANRGVNRALNTRALNQVTGGAR